MTSFLTDNLIIANPAISDNAKFESIANKAIYIIEHSKAGTVGISLNQAFSVSFHELAEKISTLKTIDPEQLLTDKVLSGGPIASDMPWILSTNIGQYEKQFSNERLALNFSLEAFSEHAPEHKAVCGLGSFGWGEGLLEKELANNLWHLFPTSSDILNSIPFTEPSLGAVQLLRALKS